MCQNRVFLGKKGAKTLIWCKKWLFFGVKKFLFFFLLDNMRFFLILWVQMIFFAFLAEICPGRKKTGLQTAILVSSEPHPKPLGLG